jgi:glyoxylase-like metal-dependent hydrolase (beta-lactamase superfamily II)
VKIDRVGDTIFFVRTEVVNWIFYADATGVTVIDGGYPGQSALLLESLESIGRSPADVRAILLTHAHIDHIGGLSALVELTGAPVYASEREAAHARREFLEQISPWAIARNLFSPRWRGWVRRIRPLIRGGLTTSLPTAAAFPNRGPLLVPGGPIPVVSRGHTTGHAGFYFPAERALVTVDSLVTAHPTSHIRGQQLLPSDFHESEAETAATLDQFLPFDVEVILPGHGPLLRSPIDEAVSSARTTLSGRRRSYRQGA